MPRRPTFASRHRQASPRAKVQRRMLLPMPREEIQALSLQYHAALEALRMKRGSPHGLRILLQVIILVGFVDEARRHEIRVEVLVAAERGVNAAFARGEEEGEWWLDAQTDELIASLLAWHDDQLRTAPLTVWSEAIERMERLRDGKPYDRPPVKNRR